MPRCPKCRCQFRVPEDEDSGHPCPRCGYGEPEEREWSDEDHALAEADRKNDEEAEERL
jgi:uncharacterized paraquat-inducible protein A